LKQFGLVNFTSLKGVLFAANVSLVLWLLTSLVLSFIVLPYVFKPVLSVLFFVGASVAIFYGCLWRSDPMCKTNQLQHCSQAEVVNAFDNIIRYTDYFLNQTIEWLKRNSEDYSTALIYLSDHGESLGENHLYLHGMPYSIAPKEQKQVPFFPWLSAEYKSANHLDQQCLAHLTGNDYSHDNLFHTVLGLLNVQTQIYIEDLDIVRVCKKAI
jgi:glucan phosphoethanolaminetransferase (alkaline phosphatase superfamily)